MNDTQRINELIAIVKLLTEGLKDVKSVCKLLQEQSTLQQEQIRLLTEAIKTKL